MSAALSGWSVIAGDAQSSSLPELTTIDNKRVFNSNARDIETSVRQVGDQQRTVFRCLVRQFIGRKTNLVAEKEVPEKANTQPKIEGTLSRRIHVRCNRVTANTYCVTQLYSW